jgi:hypothetical protein
LKTPITFLTIAAIYIVLMFNTNVYGRAIKPLVPEDTTYNAYAKYPPTFNGGWRALNDFLNSNTKTQLTGKVYTEFIVERDGSLSHIQLLHSAENDLGTEAIRLLKLSPKWTPGVNEYKNERNTDRILITLPVNFTSGSINIPDLTKQTIQDSINNHQVFYSDDTDPAFVGGENAFGKFLSHNLKYTKTAKEHNITGRVFIRLIIEVDGTLSHFEVIRDPGGGLGNETKRVLMLSPKWIPAIKNNQPVRVQYTVPVSFN